MLPRESHNDDEARPALSPGQSPVPVLSNRTVQFYARDWAAFTAWCRSAGTRPLPADAATLAAYVSEMSRKLSLGAVARRVAAISDQHRRAGFVTPTSDPAVKAVLRSIRRTASPRRDPPPSPALLGRMIAGCPGDLAGLRDRALLLLLEATSLGRGALVSLDAENVRQTSAGCALQVGEAGAQRVIQLVRSSELGKCPVRVLEEWLRISATSFGPVFRKIDRWGNVEHHRLGTDAVRRILARRMPKPRRRVARQGNDEFMPVDPA